MTQDQSSLSIDPDTRELLREIARLKQELEAVTAGSHYTPIQSLQQQTGASNAPWLELLEATLDGVGEMFIWVDEETRIIHANPATQSRLGYSLDELLHMYLSDIDHKTPPDMWRNNWQHVKEHGQFITESENTTKNGEVLPVEIFANYIEINGKGYVCALARDISRRKEMEQLAKNRETLYRHIVEQTNDGIVLINRHGDIIEWNNAMVAMSGISRDEAFSKKAWQIQWECALPEFRTPHTLDRIHDILTSALNTGQAPWLYRLQSSQLAHRNGDVFHIQQLSFPIETPDGRMLGSFIRNTNELKLVEDELLAHDALLTDALEMASLVTWEYVNGTDIFYFNDQFYALLNTTVEEQGGYQMSWDDFSARFVHPDDVHLLVEALDTGLALKDPNAVIQQEIRVLRRDGSMRHWMVRYRVQYNDIGLPERLFGANQDITERDQILEQIRALNSSLEMRVEERTRQLQEANEQLRKEIATREQAEQEIRRRERQQACIADLSQRGLAETDIDDLFTYAVDRVAHAINTPCCQILHLEPSTGNLTILASNNSKSPCMVNDSAHECSLIIQQDGDIPGDVTLRPTGRRGLNVLSKSCGEVHGLQAEIVQNGQPFAFLRVFNKANIPFIDDDHTFLQSVANLLATILSHRNMEQELITSREKYRTVANFTYDWEYWKDPSGCLLYVSPSCERISGYAASEFIDNPRLITEIVHPDDRGLLMAHLNDIELNKTGPQSIQYRIITRSGEERWIGNLSQPVFDDQGNWLGFRGSNRDITDQKRAEMALEAEHDQLLDRVESRTAELTQTNAELIHALRARDEFLATMSHELRSPLNAILSLTEILDEEVYGPLSEQQHKSMHSITESGQHLLALINDILDLSKVQSGKLQLSTGPVWITDLVHASVRLVREQAYRKGLTFSQTIDPAADVMMADERLLKQVLVNLLSNAVKFTPRSGHITLTVNANPESNTILIAVQDTGIGISPENLERLFKPFVQLDSSLSRQYSGTGLGLALVQKMVELHGGSVSVESTVGEGSNFLISLPWQRPANIGQPLQPAAPATTAKEIIQLVRLNGRAVRILLVDDSDMVITTMRELLTYNGFEVETARNGLQALEKVPVVQPDIILMDIQMPGLDGLEVTRRIRQNPLISKTIIIALSALAMPGDRERCLNAGADEYLSKPASLRRIIQVIGEKLKTAGALS